MPVPTYHAANLEEMPRLSLADEVSSWSPDKKRDFFESLTAEEATLLLFCWEFWGRDNQFPPPGNWRTWLIMTGRGWGKNRTASEYIRKRQEAGYGYFSFVGATASDTRDYMVEGESGIINVCPPWNRPVYEPSKRKVTWPNGARAILYSADEPERLRGAQHDTVWCVVGDTEVQTENGPKPIKQIKTGDLVATRSGLKRVLAARQTAPAAKVYRLETNQGHVLVATGDHPIFVVNKGGFCPLTAIEPGDTLVAWNTKNSSMLTSGGTKTTKTATTTTAVGSFTTSGCTKTPTGRSLKAMRSITSTSTPQITPRRTSRHLPERSIFANMAQEAGPRTRKHSDQPMRKSAGSIRNYASTSVSSAAKCSALTDSVLGSAIPTASKHTAARTSKITRCGLVNTAPSHFRSTSIPPRASARCIVIAVTELPILLPVYNLLIENDHEYYANDLLTHNCDELAAWRYPGAWTQLSLGLRLSRDPRAIITTTPKPIPLLHEIMKRPSTQVAVGSTYDNLSNLPPAFIEEILERYEGTHLGLQELWGRLLDKVEGALWDREDITHEPIPETIRLARCVVGVDPSTAASATQARKGTHKSNECGIVVAAKGTDGHCYVLDDQSFHGGPNEWAQRVVGAYDFHHADKVVAEVNNGGAMVEETIKTVRFHIPYEGVFASRGKVTRADPVVALYQQKKVHHVRAFELLEDQLTSWRPGEESPDRLDALVWAVSNLMVRTERPIPAVLAQALVRVRAAYS